jgi:hypothetical protein
MAHNFFKGCYSLRKMLLDDFDNDLEIIGAVKEESSLHHRVTQHQNYIRHNHLQAHEGLFSIILLNHLYIP